MKKALRIACVILSAGVFLICAAGCIEQKSPDEYGYVMLIGVDEGKMKPFHVSMLLQRGADDDEGDTAGPLIAAECENLFEAVSLLESGLPFSLTLSRTSAIVISEAVASGGKAEELLDVSLGIVFIRYHANLITAHGRADAFLRRLQSGLNKNLTKLEKGFVEFSEETGYVPVVTLAQFYDLAWSGAGDVIVPLGAKEFADEGEARPAKEKAGGMANGTPGDRNAGTIGALAEEGVIYAVDLLGEDTFLPGYMTREDGLTGGMMGSAVFKGTRMVGVLNGTHTQALLMATGHFRHGRMHIPLPDGKKISVMFTGKGKPATTLLLYDEPLASFKIDIHAAIEQPAGVASYSRQELRRGIEGYLEGLLREIFSACKAAGADVFSLGKAAVVQFDDARRWEAYDWEGAYTKTRAKFTVDAQIVFDFTRSRVE
ncbi:MAG: Ger(x)C family spore germination C-terminal domain-containing protein [Clostridiales bacterium]|jgi:spore germination protein KC|nr:Ger(x)C family spore germination C-terminal domain-containing protein [Clostridiales bacterium]